MITKEQKIEIYENTILGLRKNITPSDKDRIDIRGLKIERNTEKFRRLPLD
jgi:hypothetical protein